VFVSGVVFASAGGEDGVKRWIATDTYRVMNFAVLAIALFFIARKPVSQFLDSRINGIRDQLKELENRKEDLENTLKECNEKISLLDKEGEEILSQYIKQGENAKKKILKEAEKTVEKLEEQAKRSIEHEFANAKNKLQEQIMKQALVKAEELVKTTITPDDQERLVDEYLDKVVI
jgi:F-type H+-transporting ATPase subunit b